MSSSTAVNPSNVNRLPEQYVWEERKKTALIDRVIKAVAITVFALIASVAATSVAFASVFPIGLVAGFPLGNLAIAIGGGLGLATIKSGIKEGHLFNRFRNFFDFNDYHSKRGIERVQSEMNKGDFVKFSKLYYHENLYKYGLISRAASLAIQGLENKVKLLQKADAEWNKEIKEIIEKFEKNNTCAEAERVRERDRLTDQWKEEVNADWANIRNSVILPSFPRIVEV